MRPIDLQAMFPKTTETSRIQQYQKQAGEALQSQLAAQFNQQMEAAREKVTAKTKDKEIKLNTEDHMSKDKRENAHKKSKNKPQQNEKKIFQVKARHIDVKV